jgi:hypothetical protein
MVSRLEKIFIDRRVCWLMVFFYLDNTHFSSLEIEKLLLAHQSIFSFVQIALLFLFLLLGTQLIINERLEDCLSQSIITNVVSSHQKNSVKGY